MMEQHEITPAVGPPNPNLTEQRPILQDAGRHFKLPRGDQRAFVAEAARFGFSPADFVLDVERVRGKLSSAPSTFTVTITYIRSGRTVSYVGGPGRSWIAEFLIALIAGEFGRARRADG